LVDIICILIAFIVWIFLIQISAWRNLRYMHWIGGVFLRHNSEEVLLPFLCLQKGKDIFIRVMVTEEDPIEYAQIVLNREEKDFDLFVIGGEVYLRGENNQSVEAILVHGLMLPKKRG